MPGSDLQVRVGGVWLSSLGWWGEPKVTHRWPLGCWELTWVMNLPAYQRPYALRTGAVVEAFWGPGRIWMGKLTEPDWDQQEFVAEGLSRQAEGALCFDSGGATTSIPDTAIDQAILRGIVNWSRPASLSSVAFAEKAATDSLNYLGALLDAWSTSVSKRWAVGANGVVYAAPDPPAPTWYVMPDAGDLGVADEDYVSAVYGRYRNTTGVFSTASAIDTTPPAGPKEIGVDLTPLGRINSTKATAVVTGILAQTKAQTGWTNGLTVRPDQITSLGGIKAHGALVIAGQMVRLQGLRDERGLAAATDIVLGETVWDVTEDLVTLNPVGLAARDLASIVEKAGGSLSS